jgi:hypothetical protein
LATVGKLSVRVTDAVVPDWDGRVCRQKFPQWVGRLLSFAVDAPLTGLQAEGFEIRRIAKIDELSDYYRVMDVGE